MPPSRKTTATLRVLVIDDEKFHAEVVAESLERVGYKCVIATSGAAGLKTIEREEPDVILTDLHMDGIDGLTLLKAKQELPDAEVVVITGHGDVQTAVEAMQAGGGQLPAKAGRPRPNSGPWSTRPPNGFGSPGPTANCKQQLDEKFGFEGVVGNSPQFLEVINQAQEHRPDRRNRAHSGRDRHRQGTRRQGDP